MNIIFNGRRLTALLGFKVSSRSLSTIIALNLDIRHFEQISNFNGMVKLANF